MARYSRRRRRGGPNRRRRSSKYATRLPLKKKTKYDLHSPGVLLYRGGFELASSRGEQVQAPLGSTFCKDAVDTNDFVDYSGYGLLTVVYGGAPSATSTVHIGDVKRVWMITNSSVSNCKYIIYRCRARKDIVSTRTMAIINAAANYDRAENVAGYSNIQPTTIGGTPFDNPVLCNNFNIKPVASGVVGPGGTFEFKQKRNFRCRYSLLEDNAYDGIDSIHDNKKYSDHYIIQFHGQPCAGLDGANDVVTFAACVLDVATYARVTYALVENFGMTTQTRMETTNPFAAATSALLYTPGNIAATTAGGVPDTTLA